NLDEKKLEDMGIPADRTTAMIHNQWYSITALTSLVNSLESLKGVTGRDQVVAFAAAAANEDRARLIVAGVEMLARYHASASPIPRVSAPGPIVARTTSGAVLVPAPLDYVPWTEAVATFARRPDLKAKDRTILLTGQLTPRAKQEFAAAGWTVREGSTTGQ